METLLLQCCCYCYYHMAPKWTCSRAALLYGSVIIFRENYPCVNPCSTLPRFIGVACWVSKWRLPCTPLSHFLGENKKSMVVDINAPMGRQRDALAPASSRICHPWSLIRAANLPALSLTKRKKRNSIHFSVHSICRFAVMKRSRTVDPERFAEQNSYRLRTDKNLSQILCRQ